MEVSGWHKLYLLSQAEVHVVGTYSAFKLLFVCQQAKAKLTRKSSGGGGSRRSSTSETDPERLFVKQQKIGKGNFGEVYKG